MTELSGSPLIYEGRSTDTKPSGVPQGSTFREVDTGRIYTYSGSAWASGGNEADRWSVNAGGALVPAESGTQDIGSAALPIGNIYTGQFTPSIAHDVTGDRSDGTALTNLLTVLESLGIITDSTVA